MTTTAPAVPLSAAIREETAEAHAQSEHSAFMSRLLAGELSRAAFVDLTGQLLHLYRALEPAVAAHAGHPALAPLADGRLARAAALEADWRVLTGEGAVPEAGVAVPEAGVATAAYAERLAGLGAVELVAHHYTRYLGDLSGGQIIATMMRRHYGITEGLSFYDFSHLGKLKPYKDRYRAALDALPLSGEERRALLAEAIVAFECNRAIFEERGQRWS